VRLGSFCLDNVYGRTEVSLAWWDAPPRSMHQRNEHRVPNPPD